MRTVPCLEGAVLKADSDDRLAQWAAADWGEVVNVLAMVSGRHPVTILRHLDNSPFSRPVTLLTDINAEKHAAREEELHEQTMLATLRRLVLHGLAGRAEVAGGDPKETRYWLTGYGDEILAKLRRLGGDYRHPGAGETCELPMEGVDPGKSTPARIWAELAGAPTGFAADRAAAEQAEQAMPGMRAMARQVRRFQVSAVERLLDLGVRQFLDIGTGLPLGGAVHEVAQRTAPESRVVYVDNDPMVLAHARALLTSSPEGRTAYIQADLRDPGAILAAAGQTLDLTQPTAVFLIAVLHFLADDKDPWAVTRRLVGGVTGSCYLAVAHGADDLAPGQAARLTATYNQASSGSLTLRPYPQVAEFFTGMDMLEPGLVELSRWEGEQVPGAGEYARHGYVGIGRRAELL